METPYQSTTPSTASSSETQTPSTTEPPTYNQEITLLKSEQDYKDFIKSSNLSTSLNLDTGILNNNPQILLNLISNNENYLNKLNYQFQELDSKERFLRFLNQGSILKSYQIDDINKLNTQLINQHKVIENEVGKHKKSINVKNRKLIKVLSEVNKFEKNNNDLIQEIESLEEKLNQLDKENSLKVGDYLVSSVSEIKKITNDLENENGNLAEQLQEHEIEKKEVDLITNDKIDQLSELNNKNDDLKRELERWIKLKEQGKEANQELVKESDYLTELINIWKQFQ